MEKRKKERKKAALLHWGNDGSHRCLKDVKAKAVYLKVTF